MDQGAGPDDPKGLSFDPRSWGLEGTTPPGQPPARAAAPAEAPPATTSLNPRDWLKDIEPASEASPPAGKPFRKGPALAVAAGMGALVLVGGVTFALLRPAAGDAQAPAPKAAVAAAPTAAPQQAAATGPPGAAVGTPESTEVVDTRILSIGAPSDIPATLASMGVPQTIAAAASTEAGPALTNTGGRAIQLEVTLRRQNGDPGSETSLVRLLATLPDGSGVSVTPSGDAFAAERVESTARTVVRIARGERDGDSFYTSAVTAGLPEELINEIASAMSFDFDFQRDINEGDTFEAVWEERVNAEGDSLGGRRLIYAAMSTPQKSKALYRFVAPGTRDALWYDADGKGSRRSLMRTPVEGARVSSPFGYRFHPIHFSRRLHAGIDFAAPTGTPVYASGDGAILSAGWGGGYGNLIQLRHTNGWVSRYAHLVRFADGIRNGVPVTQGQVIGYVGTTGSSTGPHLHYEIRIDGNPVDPSTIVVDDRTALTGGALEAFRTARDRIDAARVSSN